MSFLDLPHIGFVIASYGVALIVVALLIGSIMVDYRSLRRSLAVHQVKGADSAETEDNLR
jgi:heme exporter protein CcmD